MAKINGYFKSLIKASNINTLKQFIFYFLPPGIAGQQVLVLARKEYKVLLVNTLSAIFEAFSEGATLAIIFSAVQLLSNSPGTNNSLEIPFLDFDKGQADQKFKVLLVIIFAALVFQAFQSFCKFVNIMTTGIFAARCRSFITNKVYDQILSLSYPYSSKFKVGDLTDYVAGGSEAVRIQIEQISNFFSNSLLALTYLIVLVSISPWLLISVMLILVVTTSTQKLLLPLIQRNSTKITSIGVDITTTATETFQSLRLLHSTSTLSLASSAFSKKLSNYEALLRNQSAIMGILGPLSAFLPILAIAVLIIISYLILGINSDNILASLITFVVALQRFNLRASNIAQTFSNLADNSSRLSRLDFILDNKGKEYRRVTGMKQVEFNKEIVFNSVCLRYDNSSNCALNNINFSIRKGMKIAIVGPSGAGKSSLVDLLIGLYEPTLGSITIDGVNLINISLDSWHKKLGIVSQDTLLFNSSIADNITHGLDNYRTEQLVEACRIANAEQFIEYLPNGYNTIIGERGYKLSGGQRQRLSLARAIIRDPQIYILDEATSSLDSLSEKEILDSISRLEKDKTIISIAHRLSTISRVDKILVVANGSIIEEGSHQELLKLSGQYSELWTHQSK